MWRNSGMTWQRGLAALVLVAASLTGTTAALGKESPENGHQAALLVMPAAQLPPQGQSVLTLIYQGGPFKHDKDGTVFGNRERILPLKPRGYYREYTVRTPGEGSRGGRRIVCGGQVPVKPDTCFYTDDHYASFRQIAR